MALPYDSALLKAHVPGGTAAYINRSLGTITAGDLDPNSASKVTMLNAQRASNVFGTAWNPCVYDTSSPGAARTVNRRTGTSYPDGSSWTPPTNAKGVSETGTQFSDSDDAHCVILDYPNDRILCLRQYYGGGGSEMDCYSGGVSPYNGVEQVWCKTPFTGTAPGGNGSPGTGCGINIVHGTLFPEDLEVFAANGTVRHGLRFTVKPANASTGYIFPAFKTDGATTPSSSTIKEGQYIFLDATDADIYGTSLTTGIYVPGNATATIAVRGIAEMLRTKGGRCEDRSGGGFKFSYVHEASFSNVGVTNRWLSATGGYSNPSSLMKAAVGFPWSKLKVLKESFVPSDVTVPPPDPTPDPDPVPPPSPPTAAPQTPLALTASAVTTTTTVIATLQADTTRTRTRIQRRVSPRINDDPVGNPTVTNIYDDTSSEAWGNTVVTGTPQVRRNGADELLMLGPVTISSGSAPDLWIYVDGLGGGTGTATFKAIAFPISGGTPNGQSRTFLGSEVTLAAGAAAQRLRISSALTGVANGTFALGVVIGGSSSVARIPRADDGVGEWYVDTGISYASPPSTCPTVSSGSKRSAIWATRGTPGGGPGGGTITDGETGLSAGDKYYTVYAENASGSALLDATPYPVTTSASPVPNVSPYPVIAYTIDAYVTGQNGRTVRFTDQSYDTDGTISLREWDYEGTGSWTTVASTSTSHFYAPGTYRPKLRITDDDGAVTTSAGDTTITIAAAPSPGEGVPVVIYDTGRNAAPAQARPVAGVNAGDGSGG